MIPELELCELSLTLDSEQDTQHLGECIGQNLLAPMVCYLQGDLGVGKTRLVRAIIQSRGYLGNVKSPTYTLVEPYELESFCVYHFDLYRLSDAEELDFLGIRDYFDDQSVSFIEWPEKGEGWLASADLSINLQFNGEGRLFQFTGHSKMGKKLLQKLKQDLKNNI